MAMTKRRADSPGGLVHDPITALSTDFGRYQETKGFTTGSSWSCEHAVPPVD